MNNLSNDSSLINRLINELNLQEDQAIVVLQVVSEFAKEQLPVLRGNIHSFVDAEIRSVIQRPLHDAT